MSDTPRTNAIYPPEIIDREFKEQGRQYGWGTLHDMRECSRKLERELNAALAANAELLERLQEARESHLIATARKVQTIQQQAVEIYRLKNILNHGQH
jgi:hypothetical protein